MSNIYSLYIISSNLKLCVSTSGAEWSNWADVSLLTGLHLLRTVDSATAHHEHVAQRNANGHRDKLEVNKIAARWPAKAVAQFFTFSKKGSDRIVPR